jgi:hypothetical protein
LEEAMEKIQNLELFVHGQSLWIEDLCKQVGTLHGISVPPSGLVSLPPGSEGEVADDEEEAEEEAKVRTLVEAPFFQEVISPEFTAPPEENEEPLPMAGTSIVLQPGVGYLPNSKHQAWILERICARQEANHWAYEARESDAAVRNMDFAPLFFEHFYLFSPYAFLYSAYFTVP